MKTSQNKISPLRALRWLILLLFFIPILLKAQMPVFKSDYQALVDLYNSTDGGHWVKNDGWLSGTVEEWFGVSVRNMGDSLRVVSINLPDNKLKGTIPSSIGNMPQLATLNLGNVDGPYSTSNNNVISGSIPENFRKLSNLQILILSSNNLSGPIPSWIWELGNLTQLYLDDNPLGGTIPDEVYELGNLTELKLGKCGLNGEISPNIQNLDNLAVFSAGDNNLFGTIPPEVWTLTNLTTLDLQKNHNLTGTLPVEIGNLKQLRFLHLNNNKLGGPIPDAICSLTNLFYLDLSSNSFTGPIPADIGNLTRLTYLVLSNNIHLEETIPPGIVNTSLSWLYLDNNDFSGPIPTDIGKLKGLQIFSAQQNRLSGTIPDQIGMLTKLKTINFWHNKLTGSIPSSIGQLVNLTDIDLSENQLSGAIPPSLAYLTQMTDINLSNNFLTGEIPDAFSSFPLIRFRIQNNLISEIPSLNDVSLQMYCDSNLLTFEDLERNYWLIHNRESRGVEVKYMPQLEFGREYDTTAIQIDPFTLRIPCGGVNNHYAWYKDSILIDDANDADSLVFPLVKFSDEGDYFIKVTNDLFPGDTLKSLPIHLNVIEGCMKLDLLALKDLYIATDGNNWVRHDNWFVEGKPVNTWYGITTDGCSVTEINLNNNNLHGGIPYSIGNIKGLKVLSLSDNRLGGPIPGEIDSLRSLRKLCLNGNDILNGKIPSGLWNLTRLDTLWLSDNNFTVQNIPAAIQNLKELRSLRMANTNLTGDLPDVLWSLTNLTDLELNGNALSDEISSDIGKLFNLRQLYLQDNKLYGEIPKEIGDIISLQALALDSNNLTGDLPSEMRNLKNLEYLALGNNELSGEIPEDFKDFDKLDYISIEDNLFTEIPEFTQIDSLFASEINHLTFEDFEKNLDLIRDSTVEVSYSPQLPFGKEYTVTVVEDNSYVLPIPCGGEYNHYRWFKDGVELSENDTSCYVFSSLRLSDAGSYTVSVTNDSVKNLTLGSLPVHLVVKEHCIRNDSLALVAFFYATDGMNWKYRNNWLVTPVKNWMGITADSCHVLKIDLPDNNLQGDLSLIMGDSQFGSAYFAELNHLYLDHNQLSGEFPVQLCALPELAELNLSSNNLSSEIPPEIGNLSKLTILQLDSNSFYDAIPHEIGNLSQLKILSIKNNQLRGEIPDETGNLTNLETLALGGNSLSGSIPASIGKLSKLAMLSLESNVLEGNIPDEIANLKSLEYLWLYSNQLEGTIPVGLGNLKELVEVQLQQNNLTGTMPSGFGTLTHIELLDLSYNQLLGGIPDDIGYSNNLNSVKIDHNFFDEVPDLSGMDSLFYCSMNCLTFEDFEKNLDLFHKEGFDYSYSPQRNFGREYDTTAYEGAPFTLPIPCGGQYNHYEWFKNGEKMAPVADASELYFEQVQLSDTGSYYITVWNDSVPDLNLISYPVRLKMNGVVTLISPANHSINEPVELYSLWKDALWAETYTLQVSTSPDFSSLVLSQSRILSESYLVSELDSGTTYYWRVNASDSVSTCGWSEVWDFTTVPKVPDVPVLKSPEDGSIDLDTSLVLSWYDTNWAESYNLQVSTSPDFNTLVVNQSGITSTESLVTGLDHLTTYYWRVSATNVSGTSGWSETWKFTTFQPIPDHLDFINLVIIDGQHEPKFIVGGIEFFPENNLQVFSRWGKKVYSKAGYNNELDFSNYPAGTYYYILNVKMLDGQKQFKSFVDVVKN